MMMNLLTRCDLQNEKSILSVALNLMLPSGDYMALSLVVDSQAQSSLECSQI
jgi:hypothetical protein